MVLACLGGCPGQRAQCAAALLTHKLSGSVLLAPCCSEGQMQHVQRSASQHPVFCCPGVPTDMVEGYFQLDPSSFFLGLTGVRAFGDRAASWVAPSCLA